MIRKIQRNKFAVFVSLSLISATIYLNSETIPVITPFVEYFRQNTFGERTACGALWESINYEDLGFTKSLDFAKHRIPLYEYLNLTEAKERPTQNDCPVCTNSLMKKAVRNSHRIPYGGTWLRYNVNESTESFHFQPHFCSFSETKSYVRSCFVKKNIRKIVTIGDSNSLRLMDAFARLFSYTLDRCSFVDLEASETASNPRYYLRNVSFNLFDVIFRVYGCYSCTRRHVYSYSTADDSEGKTENRTVELEQIANTRIIDDGRRIKVKLGQFLPTDISQEFILRDYLRLERYPDVILYQTAFSHEIKFGMLQHPASIVKLREPLKNLRNLMKKYVPPTSSLYWMTNQDIYEGFVRASLRNRLMRQSIDVFSDEMESDFGSMDNNVFTFFYLYELSRPIKSWHKPRDCYHMKRKWYDLIAKYILQLHCNS